MAATGLGMEDAHLKSMLETLQQQDAQIEQIVIYSKFAVAYLLQQDGPNPGWRKANIEGPVYVVRHRGNAKFQLLVKNRQSASDLMDDVHPSWELDCQQNYIFYKVDDPSKRIRGLWFHEQAERVRFEEQLERLLGSLRNPAPTAAVEPPAEPQTLAKPPQQAQPSPPPAAPAPAAAPRGQSVIVTMKTLQKVLHGLAGDEAFLQAVVGKIAQQAQT